VADPLTIGLALAGAAWGVASDRIAARWPAHDDGSVRPADWRTAVVLIVGGAAFGALGARFGGGTTTVLLGLYFLALVLLLATDLDQRLLPDVITLPLIPLALLAAVAGLDPLVAGELPLALVVAIALPAALFVLSIPFGSGAIGIGDLKLLVSVGLVAGMGRAVIGVVSGALLAGLVVALLLAIRRVSLHSYIPFGPFLIVGAMWGILLRS